MKHFCSSDEDLTALANQLEYLNFELTEEDHETFRELHQAGSLKNVSLYLGGRTFRVRLCVGGRQHVLGITRKGPNAARFADMARLFFWKYRLRDKRLPEDSEFNFGLQNTEHALEHNHEAVRLLERLRDHLVKIAELPIVSAASESERAARQAAREARRTVRGELLFIHEENQKRAKALEATLLTFEKTIQSNLKLFDEIKIAFHHILEQLALASKEREQLRHMVAAPLFVGSPNPQTDATPALPPDVIYCAASSKVIT